MYSTAKWTMDQVTLNILILSLGDSDPKMLIYVDFLDALVRVSAHYPFPDSEDYNRMEDKLVYIVHKLEEKFGIVKEGFIKSLEQKDKDMGFVCKMVINDESDNEGKYIL